MVERDTQFAVATAPKRNSFHWVNGVVTWGELLDWMATPDNVKECGNYMMGTLKPTTRTHNQDDGPCTKLHRNKEAVVTRSMLTLDLDTPTTSMPDVLDMVLGYTAVLHTTFQSTPTAPRYRLIIPLDREVAPDEYAAAALSVVNTLGTDYFDPSTAEPERYMFKPAAEELENFQWWLYDGPLASADELLADFDADLSTLPLPNPPKGKRNPFEIEGVVGAFNRAYEDIQLLITEYDLPYSPAGSGRWHLVGSKAVAGMGAVSSGIVYSHHANDPAYGQACTAFDLVRLHRFGELDENTKPGTPINRLPSYNSMLDVAQVDARVTAELVGLDFAEAMDETASVDSWKLTLGPHMDRKGHLKDTADAWGIIRTHDPVIKNLFFNEMTFAIETTEDLPWRPSRHGGPTIRNSDRLSMQAYLETEYRTQPSARRVDWLIDETAMRQYRNPVRDWLGKLEWDGTPRLEECLPGVTSTPYTRMVARKSLVAAVARMLEPGCKWDHTLILYGPEGIGKTHWIEQMSRGWTAPLGTIGHKDTLINLQRCWIATSDEGASMRKSDAEALKEFLTRRVDVFRLPYEREATAHPRHCVVWGTTNDAVFLRHQEGNRRFLIVRSEQAVDFAQLTDHYIEQVWAEAVHLYRMGEVLLWLNGEESALAAEERGAFVEEGGTALEGLLQDFLETPLPKNWYQRSVEGRQMWLRDHADGLEPDGEILLDGVCAIQMYVEALGRPQGHHTRLDLLEIGRALRALGWQPQRERSRIAPYGPQQTYLRPSTIEDLL